MNVEFAREPFSAELSDEARDMMRVYHDEVANISPLNFSGALYEMAQGRGVLWVFTARDAGKLVGFSASMTGFHPHAAGELQATQLALFVLPEYRRGPLGLKFVRYADDVLQAAGVRVVFRNETPRRRLRPLFHSMGYEEADVVYARRLAPAVEPRQTIMGAQ